MFHDIYNLLMLVLVFNSVVYGIYNWGAFRRGVETLFPFLKGFQFNRTVFFSPFLWYMSFFIILQRIYETAAEKEKAGKGLGSALAGLGRLAANGMAWIAIAVIFLSPTRYNDLLATCKNKAIEAVKGKTADRMNYEEFYSEELFREIKEDIGYGGEWSVAYGLHPAVLEYNGIATLDGYLGFYPQQYKEDFRRIIAPALERVEESRIYYDDWGARAYLYSGSEPSVVSDSKSFQIGDRNLYMDGEAFEELGGRYLFSRFELTNAEAAGLKFVNDYGTEASPYKIYLYGRF